MPRKPRLFVPGCVHHVMARGLDGMDIFKDDTDRSRFLEYFEVYFRETGMRCYAWVLMANHYHFVLRTAEAPLADLMKPLNSKYAGYFNKRYNRRGYLYQDRFKSVATQEQLYIEELVRYVHLNPLRAGICRNFESLDVYPWSGHAVLMGNVACSFQDTAAVLRRFGTEKNAARKSYQCFIKAGTEHGDDATASIFRTSTHNGGNRSKPERWVIGDDEFVRQSISHDKMRRVRLARYAAEGWNMDRACAHIAEQLGIDTAEIKARSQRGEASRAKKILAWVCHYKLEIPAVEIARYLNVGASAVSMMLKDGGKHIETVDMGFFD